VLAIIVALCIGLTIFIGCCVLADRAMRSDPGPERLWRCDYCGAAFMRGLNDVRAQCAAHGALRCEGCMRKGARR
jgi:hypothetical protein